jgi:hypothetical protein
VIENEGVIADVLETLGNKVELLNVEIEEKSPGIRRDTQHNNTQYNNTQCRDAPLVRPNGEAVTNPNPATSGVDIPNNKTISNNVARFRPHIHHTGGFFIAKFKKIKSIQNPNKNTLSEHPHPERTLTHHDTITNPNILLIQTKHTIRAVAKRFSEIQHQLFIQRAGLPIFKVLSDGQRKPLPGLKKISER